MLLLLSHFADRETEVCRKRAGTQATSVIGGFGSGHTVWEGLTARAGVLPLGKEHSEHCADWAGVQGRSHTLVPLPTQFSQVTHDLYLEGNNDLDIRGLAEELE